MSHLSPQHQARLSGRSPAGPRGARPRRRTAGPRRRPARPRGAGGRRPPAHTPRAAWENPHKARGTRPQGQLHTSHFAPVLSSQGRVSRLRPRPAGSPRSSLTWAAKATVRSALPAPPWPCPSSLSVLPSAGPRRAPALCRPSSAGPSPARHWPSPSGKMAAQ